MANDSEVQKFIESNVQSNGELWINYYGTILDLRKFKCCIFSKYDSFIAYIQYNNIFNNKLYI